MRPSSLQLQRPRLFASSRRDQLCLPSPAESEDSSHRFKSFLVLSATRNRPFFFFFLSSSPPRLFTLKVEPASCAALPSSALPFPLGVVSRRLFLPSFSRRDALFPSDVFLRSPESTAALLPPRPVSVGLLTAAAASSSSSLSSSSASSPASVCEESLLGFSPGKESGSWPVSCAMAAGVKLLERQVTRQRVSMCLHAGRKVQRRETS
ncbi:hypothetical protein TGP89_366010 [Toxoplasma gondii p89]|uniref:Uncharacterized protein n=2 Tax=Toxoplasma gondii TaxID=5811 RepID=A0A2T6IED6_TOXGO|nr:hypothetical protein TGP89_366010 [Toxoplasma gondii p89]PUA83669.1 hypothetical protein TGBR9_366010 [Toxoplasma gondii TgCATBr9]